MLRIIAYRLTADELASQIISLIEADLFRNSPERF